MNEDLNIIFDLAKDSMGNAISHLEKKLLNIRAGKANPNMLSNVYVDYYGTKTPIAQVSNINTPDGRTIVIQPWDKSMLQEIEKGIEVANLGFNPVNNGENLIINVPILTEERRKELIKILKNMGEKGKISIRNIRREANEDLKKKLKEKSISEDENKNYEKNIQKLTDTSIENIDKILSDKEKEILQV